MKRRWIKILIAVVIVSAILLTRVLIKDDYLDIHHLKQHKEELLALIDSHYPEAVLCFIALYIGSALFLPGALALTVAGGMAFGVLPTVLYANLGASAGAVLAFVISRFVIGEWVQHRFRRHLDRFNKEMSQHGKNYLLTLRIVPIAPFFVVNYCAGLTRMPLWTFLWTTSVGMLPGSAIYAYLGQQLRQLRGTADVFSWKILLAFLMLALFALLPVILHHLPSAKK